TLHRYLRLCRRLVRALRRAPHADVGSRVAAWERIALFLAAARGHRTLAKISATESAEECTVRPRWTLWPSEPSGPRRTRWTGRSAWTHRACRARRSCWSNWTLRPRGTHRSDLT